MAAKAAGFTFVHHTELRSAIQPAAESVTDSSAPDSAADVEGAVGSNADDEVRSSFAAAALQENEDTESTPINEPSQGAAARPQQVIIINILNSIWNVCL